MSNVGKIFKLKTTHALNALLRADLKESFGFGKVMTELDPEIPGGLRFHKPLGGCAYWNIDDVEEVKHPLRGLGTTKCTPPKFRDYRGRTWDLGTVILPWGEEVDCHLDTTWGEYAYFRYASTWRKFKMCHYDGPLDRNDFPLSTYEKPLW